MWKRVTETRWARSDGASVVQLDTTAGRWVGYGPGARPLPTWNNSRRRHFKTPQAACIQVDQAFPAGRPMPLEIIDDRLSRNSDPAAQNGG